MPVIFSVFAGRERYIKILKVYIDRLLERELIHTVHIWNFTLLKEDTTYIHNLCAENCKYVLMEPKSKIKKNWDPYYEYYKTNIKDDEILIKCDDDIVYIDIEGFKAFIDSVKDDVIYFPNIVNNDVCAYFQTKLGVHMLFDYPVSVAKKTGIGDTNPLTKSSQRICWFEDHHKADAIHRLFIEDPAQFHLNDIPIINYGNRVSINMFALNAAAVRRYFFTFLMMGHSDDEAFLSAKICEVLGVYNRINLNMCIVHFQFFKQDGFTLDMRHLSHYYNLANSR